MKKFEILEHKADIKIKVFGETPEELFKNAVGAMAEILIKNSPFTAEQAKLTKTLITKSVNREILLVDFLNDILGESQINQAIYPEVKFIEFHPESIKAEIKGCLIKRFDEDIKAVTYHDLSIRQNKKGIWEAVILFDV